MIIKNHISFSTRKSISVPYLVSDIDLALKKTKAGKAAGVDGIFPELLKNLGPLARTWLASMFTYCHSTGVVPSIWREAKTIAILKPGKPADRLESYRPISLLCTTYKLFERLLTRISPLVEPTLPAEQAGFCPGRSCADQVLALTTNIEAGFQRHLKTGVALVDISSAYDTVGRHGLLLKVARTVKCRSTMRLLSSILSNRRFRACLGDQNSSIRTLNNGLPQGSVLAPTLFSDMPTTISNKFAYADDLALATQGTDLTDISDTLLKDLDAMATYFSYWYLCLNPAKTTVTAFHLNNHMADACLNVTALGIPVRNEDHPVYLRVTLDRSLTYRQHITKLATKAKSRVNIINKLTGTSWGSKATILCTSSLALMYSAAEYCSPTWSQSSHVKKIDTILNATIRTITGILRPTPLLWLPVLSNTTPPSICRQNRALRQLLQCVNNQNFPIHKDLSDIPKTRLKSCKPMDSWQDPTRGNFLCELYMAQDLGKCHHSQQVSCRGSMQRTTRLPTT